MLRTFALTGFILICFCYLSCNSRKAESIEIVINNLNDFDRMTIISIKGSDTIEKIQTLFDKKEKADIKFPRTYEITIKGKDFSEEYAGDAGNIRSDRISYVLPQGKDLEFFKTLLVRSDKNSNCDSGSNHKYDSIISGLSKNYVLIIQNQDISSQQRGYFLESFKKDEPIFKKDSIDYYWALNEFFNADICILEYLIQKYYDSDEKCDFVYTRNPFSSLSHWADNISNKQGSVYLIYQYLTNDSIPVDGLRQPDEIEKIILSVETKDMWIWLLERRNQSRENLKKESAKLRQKVDEKTEERLEKRRLLESRRQL